MAPPGEELVREGNVAWNEACCGSAEKFLSVHEENLFYLAKTLN